MIRVEFQPKRGDVTIHLDDDGIENLHSALGDAARGNKVFLGESGAMLILRPESFTGNEEPDA